MRFHVVALPHTQVTRAYSSCAYTQKVIGFCRMMKALGHHVTLYAGEQNEAPCDEHVVCIDERERAAAVGQAHYTQATFDWSLPHWQTFNSNVIAGIKARSQRQDFICVIGGRAHEQIDQAFPNMLTVEFGVGYGGYFSAYKVFESYAWMHTCYGAKSGGDPHAIDGQWYDTVIPGYLDPSDFPYRGGRRSDDYCLFVGRMIDRKGIAIASQVCRELGKRLVVAGPGRPPADCEYAGVVGPKERGELMAGATALLAPTIYVEPFGNVAIEAMACGTPVIATDWGAFTETIIPEVTGFRCRSFAEFCKAVEVSSSLDPAAIRSYVLRNYSLDVIGLKYQAYFELLLTLWGDGWYARAS